MSLLTYNAEDVMMEGKLHGPRVPIYRIRTESAVYGIIAWTLHTTVVNGDVDPSRSSLFFNRAEAERAAEFARTKTDMHWFVESHPAPAARR